MRCPHPEYFQVRPFLRSERHLRLSQIPQSFLNSHRFRTLNPHSCNLRFPGIPGLRPRPFYRNCRPCSSRRNYPLKRCCLSPLQQDTSLHIPHLSILCKILSPAHSCQVISKFHSADIPAYKRHQNSHCLSKAHPNLKAYFP